MNKINIYFLVLTYYIFTYLCQSIYHPIMFKIVGTFSTIKVFVIFKTKEYFKIIIIQNVYQKSLSFVKALRCMQYFIHRALNLFSQCKHYALFIIIQLRYVYINKVSLWYACFRPLWNTTRFATIDAFALKFPEYFLVYLYMLLSYCCWKL